MAGKQISTRLVLRNGAIADWTSSTVKLLKGEAALAQLTDGNYELRIGTGDKTWSELAACNVVIPSTNVTNLTYDEYKLSSLAITEGEESAKFQLMGRIPGQTEFTAIGDPIVIPGFGQVEADIQYLSGQISAEVERATAAEAAISADFESKLAAEVTRATDAENAISTAFDTKLAAEEAARKADDNALSTAFDAKLAAEETARKADDKALSDAIDAEVERATEAESKLSTDFDAKLAAEVTRATEAEEKIVDDWAALSVEIGLDKASAENKVATMDDIKDLTGAMHFRGAITPNEGETDLQAIERVVTDPAAGDFVIMTNDSKEFVYANGQWNELGDESIYLKTADFETWRDTTLENRLTSIEKSVEDEETRATEAENELSDAIKAEAEQRAADDAVLSTAIDNKIKVGNYGEELVNQSELSVVKIADEDYYKLVAEEKLNPDVVYVVSSDYVNAHGERVINVASPEISSDAANKDYVDVEITKAKEEIVSNALSGVSLNGQTFEVANNVASLTIDVIDCGGAN